MIEIYFNKVIENECSFRKGIECCNCGYCQSNTDRTVKKINTYYDYHLEMLFHEYLIPNNNDLKLGDIVELTFEDDNDSNCYKYKIVKKDKYNLILVEYYNKYYKVKKAHVAFDKGVKTIDALKELKVVL